MLNGFKVSNVFPKVRKMMPAKYFTMKNLKSGACALLIFCFLFSVISFCGCERKDSPKKTVAAVKKIIPRAKHPAKTEPDASKGDKGKAAEKDGKEVAKKGKQGPETNKDIQASQESESTDASDALELYNPAGKINPFAPLFKEEQVVTTVKPNKKRRRAHLTPLEKVDLSQLKLLGTILAPSGNRAMVADSSGKGYVVSKGTYIGMSSGRIVRILKNRIIVEEEVENLLGKISLRKRELRLQKPPGD